MRGATVVKADRQSLFDEKFLARLEQLHLLGKRLAAQGSAGLRRSRRLGDGLEFADHRDYTPGDDIRFIDWPYYARMGQLLLRLFHEHSDADVFLLLDCSASMAPGGAGAKFDYARRVAAALGYVAMGGLERVHLLPFAQELLPGLTTGRNRGQILSVLDFLAGLEVQGRTQLGEVVENLTRTCSPQGTVILISDLLDSSAELPAALARLLRSNVAVVQLYLPQDARPQFEGPVTLRQAETLQEINVQMTPALLESYRLQWEGFLRTCQKICLAKGANYMAASTAMPFDHLVLQTLRRAGVLG